MKIIYYYHIPKCGGTTISNELKRLAKSLRGEYHNFNTPMRNFGLRRKVANNFQLKRFLGRINDKTNAFKFVHHHHGYYGIGEIHDRLLQQKELAESVGNEFFLFTCIRDPLSFQISRTNHLRRVMMPSITFDTVCENASHQNFMGKYLLFNHPKRWKKNPHLDEQQLMRNVGIMDNIFLLEDINSLRAWLSQLTGVPIQSSDRKDNAGEYLLLPDDEQREALLRVNALDQLFYDVAKQRSCNQPSQT